MALAKNTLEADGTVRNVHKKHSAIKKSFKYRGDNISFRQAAGDVTLSKSTAHRILRHLYVKSFIPCLIQALNEDVPAR